MKAIQELAVQVEKSYRDIVWKAANGEEVDPQEALETTIAANRSVERLNLDISRLERRIASKAKYEAVDFDVKIEAAKADLVQARADLATSIEAAKEAVLARVEAHNREDAAGRRVTQLERQQQDAWNEMSKCMNDTGGDPDPFEVENFTLI